MSSRSSKGTGGKKKSGGTAARKPAARPGSHEKVLDDLSGFFGHKKAKAKAKGKK
jgi:hypothetical protein